MTTPPNNEAEEPMSTPDDVDRILLQFIAEYHQGLNELAGHGTAIEQARAALDAHYLGVALGALPEITFNEVVEAGQTPTPEEHKKMVWLMNYYRDKYKGALRQALQQGKGKEG